MKATVKLYNPYHDKLGRFASKPGGKVALIKSSESEREFSVSSAKWSGLVKFISSGNSLFKVAEEKALTEVLTEATNELVEMGIKDFDHKKVTFDDKYLRGLGKYSLENKEVILGGDLVSAVLSRDMDKEFSLDLISHELYHARKSARKDMYANSDIEEGLATIAGAIVGKRTHDGRLRSGKITDADLNDGLIEFMIDKLSYYISDTYLERAIRLFDASEYAAEDEARYSYTSREISPIKYLTKWLIDSDKEHDTNMREIMGMFDYMKYIKKFENSTKLFNPYHDSLGRFASKPSSGVALLPTTVRKPNLDEVKQAFTDWTSQQDEFKSIHPDYKNPDTPVNTTYNLMSFAVGIAYDARAAARGPDRDNILAAFSEKGIEALATFDRYKTTDLGNVIEVKGLSTAPKNMKGFNNPDRQKGVGTKILIELAKMALTEGRQLLLLPLSSAIDYYNKLGFKKVTPSSIRMFLDADGVERLANAEISD